MAALQVKYTCNTCSIYRVVVHVVEREPAEDISLWMEKITLQLQADHWYRSPGCPARTLSEVMIPISGVERIGEVSRN